DAGALVLVDGRGRDRDVGEVAVHRAVVVAAQRGVVDRDVAVQAEDAPAGGVPHGGAEERDVAALAHDTGGATPDVDVREHQVAHTGCGVDLGARFHVDPEVLELEVV